MRATARDLRFYSKNLLDAVSRGEEVLITYRGKPCAKLVPLEKGETTELQADPLFGIWKDRTDIKDVEKYIRSLRKGKR